MCSGCTSGSPTMLRRCAVTITNGLMEVRAKLPPPQFRNWPAAWAISANNRRDQGLCWASGNQRKLSYFARIWAVPNRWCLCD